MITAQGSARLRAFHGPAALAIAVLSSLVLVQSASASTVTPAAATACTGTIGAETVGSLVVPDGETCTLNGTTVEGSVTVGEGSSLITDGATITQNVKANDGPGTVQLLDTDVLLNIFVTGATGKVVIGPAGCAVDPVVGNNVFLRDNEGTVAICYMSIGQNLKVSGNHASVGIFHSVVGNNLAVTGTTGNAVRIRDNAAGNNIQVDDNEVALKILLTRNHAGSHLDCGGNTPDPMGSGNTADGGLTGQCAGLG